MQSTCLNERRKGNRRGKKELDGYEADRKLAQMHVESAEIVVLGFQ